MSPCIASFVALLLQDAVPPLWNPPIGELRIERLDESRDPKMVVVAKDLGVFEVLQRVAVETGRHLRVDPEAGDVLVPVNVHLEGHPLSDVVTFVAGCAGMEAEIDAERILLLPSELESLPPREKMQRALGEYRRALLTYRRSEEAGEIRFAIADTLYQLGEFGEAAQEYSQLRTLEPDFPEMAVLLYRMGHAFQRAGNVTEAIKTWLLLGEKLKPGDAATAALAAAALTEVARSYLEAGDRARAVVAVRRLVETWPEPLGPDLLAEAGWLLLDCGDPERASVAFDEALQGKSETAAETARAGRAAVALRAGLSLEIVSSIQDYLEHHPRGRYAAQLTFELARAHVDLESHGTALLCLRRATELDQDPALLDQCTLLEAQLWKDCGLAERALDLFDSLHGARTPGLSRLALEGAAETALDDGQLQRASGYFEQMEERFPETEGAALLGQAEVAMRRRNWDRARELVERALPLTQRAAERARLLEMAMQLATPPAKAPDDTEDRS